MTTLGPAAKARGCTINAGNNLGYYGPAERHLRIEPYGGCGAGRFVLGVESNGDVKGCPSLPSAPYVGGNVREAPLAEIWERQAIGFARDRGTSELWGFCKTCYYAEVCQGGCSWTAHALLGRRGNMPWCLHRSDKYPGQLDAFPVVGPVTYTDDYGAPRSSGRSHQGSDIMASTACCGLAYFFMSRNRATPIRSSGTGTRNPSLPDSR